VARAPPAGPGDERRDGERPQLILSPLEREVVTLRGITGYVLAASSRLPTPHGVMDLVSFRSEERQDELIALVNGGKDAAGRQVPLVRVHSACLTGEVLQSLRCDCAAQLDHAIKAIASAEWGIVVYLPSHEGRGIGLVNKVRAYALQDRGADTIQANQQLGLDVDARDYSGAAAALLDLGASRVRLMTNNPEKIRALEAAGIVVAERVPLWQPSNVHNRAYLEVKRDHMGHFPPDESANVGATMEPA
jgi:GTP cyclohydrolase II